MPRSPWDANSVTLLDLAQRAHFVLLLWCCGMYSSDSRRLRLYDCLIPWFVGFGVMLVVGFFIVVIGEAVYGW